MLLRIKISKTVKCAFKLKEKFHKYDRNGMKKINITSGERIKLGGAEKGQEFELRTMTEKST